MREANDFVHVKNHVEKRPLLAGYHNTNYILKYNKRPLELKTYGWYMGCLFELSFTHE